MSDVTVDGIILHLPEMRFTPSGHSVTSLRLYTEEGDLLYYCYGWNKVAEELNQLELQDKIHATGYIKTHQWNGANGQHHVRDELVITYFRVVDPEHSHENVLNVDEEEI